MAWKGRDKRKSPRVAVMMRVKGQLVAVEMPIVVHDLSRSGFAVVSTKAFEPGDTLDFRLEGAGEPAIAISAQAIHSRPFGSSANLHLSGFRFIPGPLTGFIPQAAIDRLFEAIRTPERLLSAG
jgi:hypothetical protein